MKSGSMFRCWFQSKADQKLHRDMTRSSLRLDDERGLDSMSIDRRMKLSCGLWEAREDRRPRAQRRRGRTRGRGRGRGGWRAGAAGRRRGGPR